MRDLNNLSYVNKQLHQKRVFHECVQVAFSAVSGYNKNDKQFLVGVQLKDKENPLDVMGQIM